MIQRPDYIDRLRAAESRPLIPVLTGIRLCGKSSILALYAEDLLSRGTDPSGLLRINMESLEFDSLREYGAMNRFVRERLPRGAVCFWTRPRKSKVGNGWQRPWRRREQFDAC